MTPVGRVGVTVVGYGALALMVLALTGWLRTTLALPPMFGGLVRAGLVVGLGAAVVMAWRYPELGGSDGADDLTGGNPPEA